MNDKHREDDEIEIDLGRLFGILWDRKKVAGGIIAACTLIAMIISLIIPPTFESNTLVQTNSANKMEMSGAAAAMAMLGGGSGAASPTNNYIEMMKSRTVLEPIMDQLDIPPETREKMTAAGFAKTKLEIQNIKGTNLINVVGKGRTPEEAQMISASVVENFLKMMTDMNQSSQSFMVKFLNERIDTAKKESDEAAAKLEDYSKAHKVYSPDDQSKAVLERTALYDKAIGDLQVKQQSASAKLAAVGNELGKQNANLSAYNVADSEVVVALREQIANQEVAIVKLEQKYTENHPDLINARKTLQAMKDNLIQEVAAAVAGGTASMNPTQAALVEAQAMAQVEMAVASASEAAVRAQMANSEADMAQLSEAALGYLKLKRNANIKNEIYVSLVRQSEQSRIQATMESMDIQIVDKADLPVQKSAPRRTLITLCGMGFGVFIALIYGFWLYKKEDMV